MEPVRGHPLLMLYSVVDDRSGVAYQEYHGVYGEDVEAALRFLFAAMSPKSLDDSPFQGIPRMLYLDNGPIARSQVFNQVMGYLGIEVRTHLPQGKDGRRVTARSKGKVERPSVGGPIPLHRYRSFKKTQTERRADRIEWLAKQLVLPRSAWETPLPLTDASAAVELPTQPFADPDPFQEFTFPSVLVAKRAISDYLGLPLAKLTEPQRQFIETILANTLNKQQVLTQVQAYFHPTARSPHVE